MYLYCFDGNGNVVNLVDAVSGGIAATYEYSAFGVLTRSDGPLADANPVRWSTKHTDDETGLVMYEYRAYLPDWGRWMNRDPIGEMGGGSSYLTAQNNLVVFIASSGQGIVIGPIAGGVDFVIGPGIPPPDDGWEDPPPYTPRRCPAGQRWVMSPDGSVPEANGCSVPDSLAPWLPSGDAHDPTGVCSFRSACDNHDYCYSRCGRRRTRYTGRRNCDRSFLDNMRRVCDGCPLTFQQRTICRTWAYIYYLAVRSAGTGPFRERQDLNCHCACR